MADIVVIVVPLGRRTQWINCYNHRRCGGSSLIFLFLYPHYYTSDLLPGSNVVVMVTGGNVTTEELCDLVR